MNRKHSLALFALLVLTLLSACAPPQPGGAIPTSSPVVVVPTNTPAPTPSPVLSANEAPTFAEIRAAIAAIIAKGENTFDEIQAYAQSLQGKVITARYGWVGSSYLSPTGENGLFVYLEDPYSAEALAVPSVSAGNELINGYLTPVTADVLGAAISGSQVLITGQITGIDYFASVTINIEPQEVSVVNKPAVVNSGSPVVVATPLPNVQVPVSNPTQSEIEDKLATISYEEIDQYVNSLNGQTVENWSGWVVEQTGDGWLITTDDPYNTEVGARPGLSERGENFRQGRFILTGANAANLKLGQYVSFNGTLQVAGETYLTTFNIALSKLTVLEDRLAGIAAPADLAGLIMRLERTQCFGTCPAYSVTVYGNGIVVWNGIAFTGAKGPRFSVVSEETVRALLAEYEKAGFTNLNDEYTEYRVTDLPSAYTTLTYNGQTKHINRYEGDSTAPARLILLEDRFDYLVNTAQWIGEQQ